MHDLGALTTQERYLILCVMSLLEKGQNFGDYVAKCGDARLQTAYGESVKSVVNFRSQVFIRMVMVSCDVAENCLQITGWKLRPIRKT